MAKHKKKSGPTFDPEPLTGDHRVTDDGDFIFIGDKKFRRQVLPNAGELHRQAQELAEDLEEID